MVVAVANKANLRWPLVETCMDEQLGRWTHNMPCPKFPNCSVKRESDGKR